MDNIHMNVNEESRVFGTISIVREIFIILYLFFAVVFVYLIIEGMFTASLSSIVLMLFLRLYHENFLVNKKICEVLHKKTNANI